jgi:hypothetical protein
LIARHGSREVRRRDKDATSVSREARKQRETHLRLVGLVLRLAGLFLHINVSRLMRRHQSLVGQLVSNLHSHLASVRLAVAVAGMKLEEVRRRMLHHRVRRPGLLRACLPNYTLVSALYLLFP